MRIVNDIYIYIYFVERHRSKNVPKSQNNTIRMLLVLCNKHSRTRLTDTNTTKDKVHFMIPTTINSVGCIDHLQNRSKEWSTLLWQIRLKAF
jgi:hypothetical protein